MKLKDGYSLVWGERSSHLGCGAGTTVQVELVKDGQVVKQFITCPCGRGCGGLDCVSDDWGDHDCTPEIEAARDD